ncbi:MAG: hypothetical protein ACRC0A_01665 [Chitinophagaceae bacterium]
MMTFPEIEKRKRKTKKHNDYINSLITQEIVDKVRKLYYPTDSDVELFNYLRGKGIIVFSESKFVKDILDYRKFVKGNTDIYNEDNHKHVLKRDFYEAVLHIRNNCRSFFKDKIIAVANNDQKGDIVIKAYQTLFSKDIDKSDINVNINPSIINMIRDGNATVDVTDDTEL